MVIGAALARHMSSEKYNDPYENQIDLINYKIKRACRRGHTCVVIREVVDTEVINTLAVAGFDIDMDFNRNRAHPWIYVYWDEPEEIDIDEEEDDDE